MTTESRRLFNNREHNLLYSLSGGRCAICGIDLEPGWHADHIKPYSRGGRTDLTNGQPLCPRCNLVKGNSQVTYTDAFQPRPFQREVISSVLDGMSSGRRATVVLASPGSGKTIAYQATATYLYREGLIDYVAVFVPRLTLARQCETSWMWRKPTEDGNGFVTCCDHPQGCKASHSLFDESARMGAIRHVPNKKPLTSRNQTGAGIVTTYSSLTTSPHVFMEWAEEHRGRFLLVSDEAQFCGTARELDASGGTEAGRWMKALHEYAAHTLLLTGTPYRSDGQPLILADYEPEDEEGKRKLVCHAEAGYADGIAEGYLRRFEATMHDARVRYKFFDNSAIEYDLSTSAADLREVMRKPDVWQPICDGVVTAVQEKQAVHPDYRGLISCMEQGEAKRVRDYLVRKYPGLRVMISISEDGPEAERALRHFKSVGADVLVTVRKAFIGYDCPEITVVGILTHYRDRGHLLQLVGRGLRTWAEVDQRSQSCRVICPDDPLMQRFVEFMRGESEQGLRERERRERAKGNDKPEQSELGYVESANITTARSVSNDGEADHELRLLIEAHKRDLGLTEDVTGLAEFYKRMQSASNAGQGDATVSLIPARTQPSAPPMTEQEQIEEVNRQTHEEVRGYLSRNGILAKHPQYGKLASRVTAAVNTAAGGIRAEDVRTLEQAQARLDAARILPERISA